MRARLALSLGLSAFLPACLDVTTTGVPTGSPRAVGLIWECEATYPCEGADHGIAIDVCAEPGTDAAEVSGEQCDDFARDACQWLPRAGEVCKRVSCTPTPIPCLAN